jgi:hypothetical protein
MALNALWGETGETKHRQGCLYGRDPVLPMQTQRIRGYTVRENWRFYETNPQKSLRMEAEAHET